ncbi:hypothetical protein V1289_002847 [Bradyrhizobium sp. AZCC 2289]
MLGGNTPISTRSHPNALTWRSTCSIVGSPCISTPARSAILRRLEKEFTIGGLGDELPVVPVANLLAGG